MINNFSMKTKIRFVFILSTLFFCFVTESQAADKVIKLESLLTELTSVEESACYPSPFYTCHQESSYDRRSVSPSLPHWFANADGFGFDRIDTIDNRIEKVLFDQKGPGVITRIWLTTLDKRGTIRFYFDGSSIPAWIIPAYDLMKFGIFLSTKGLLLPHTSYTPDGKGGNTLFLPIPYAKGCKVTFEEQKGVASTPKYYQINYRKYAVGTAVETFSEQVLNRAKTKIAETDSLLATGLTPKKGTSLNHKKTLIPNDTLNIMLPHGENAVYEVQFKVNLKNSKLYAQIMREVIFQASFDGKQTVWVPLSDFSGGGMGAPYVKSWFLSSDAKGSITSRWLMSYQRRGMLTLKNLSKTNLDVSIKVHVSPLAWNERSLYFHSSWKQQTGLQENDNPDDDKHCKEWNFSTIIGRGVYKGDVLTLFNHTPAWYGEGDEKIWVDKDTFPSHFGTGTEDYYNSSWAPVVPFQTPFGGAPRADQESSSGYNTFFRTRNLDGIPFTNKFCFNLELLSWVKGKVDLASTVYWYGDYSSKAVGTSGEKEAKHKLLPPPENPMKYKINNSIEFETLTPIDLSPSIHIEKQTMNGFVGGKWSEGAQLICNGGKLDDFIEFCFKDLKNQPYKIALYVTKAEDYGIISFVVNGKTLPLLFDCYSKKVTISKAIELGTFIPEEGKIILRIKIAGTNPSTLGAHYLLGLDCIQLLAK